MTAFNSLATSAQAITFRSLPGTVLQDHALPAFEQFLPPLVQPRLHTVADRVEEVDSEVGHPFIRAEPEGARFALSLTRNGRLAGSGQTAEQDEQRSIT